MKRIHYITSSDFKVQENRAFSEVCKLSDGRPVRDMVEFMIRRVPILETLEVQLEVMVQAEVVNAYAQIKVPCIVEHAGLIFEDYRAESYPGGLTKPMWNTLGDRFIVETRSAGRRAAACAVVAYCNGMSVRTFKGETLGTLAETPRGSRKFYWDTVFIPDDLEGKTADNKTYAEIVEEYGLEYKMEHFSQSSKAMLKFLEFYVHEEVPSLWRGV